MKVHDYFLFVKIERIVSPRGEEKSTGPEEQGGLWKVR